MNTTTGSISRFGICQHQAFNIVNSIIKYVDNGDPVLLIYLPHFKELVRYNPSLFPWQVQMNSNHYKFFNFYPGNYFTIARSYDEEGFDISKDDMMRIIAFHICLYPDVKISYYTERLGRRDFTY